VVQSYIVLKRVRNSTQASFIFAGKPWSSKAVANTESLQVFL
jgi:hypothetical protein